MKRGARVVGLVLTWLVLAWLVPGGGWALGNAAGRVQGRKAEGRTQEGRVKGALALEGRDVRGRTVTLLPAAGARVAVLFFVASDCPISNRYWPEIKRMEREFAGHGADFWFVYPNVTETEATIGAHRAAYGVGSHVLTDRDQRLARQTGAVVTPEAAIVSYEGGTLKTLYAGRIDDRYLSIGRERPQATRHDLEEAIGAALAGRAVSAPGGPVVGCGIVSVK